VSKYTKGPWEFGNTTNDKKLILGGTSRDYVCSVQIWQTPRRMGLIDEPEREANAQLISAAPELLEACKIVRAEIGNKYYNFYPKLKQAIAKAEGLNEKREE